MQQQRTVSYLAVSEIKCTHRLSPDSPIPPDVDKITAAATLEKVTDAGFWGVNWVELGNDEKIAVLWLHQTGRVRLARVSYHWPSGPVGGSEWISVLIA